jgi:hypothetical protein
MCQILLNRGPDDEGSYARGSVGWQSGLHRSNKVQMSGGTDIAAKCGAPVFVVGCPRSGTTLLYHMLLSAGGFAVYRAESNVFNLLLPRFGDLGVRRNRQRLMNTWLRTRMFTVSGLDAKQIEAKILDECRDYGDFLRIVMEEVALRQNARRWADCTPEHLLYLREIEESLPGALIIHIIRDGRDVALSIDKQRWVRAFWWDKKRSLMAAALYWRWMVRRGREYGRILGPRYMEVRYEDLVTEPRRILVEVGRFVDHDLDYDRILRTGIGSVSQPNTSFEFSNQEREFDPLGRWKKLLSTQDLEEVEGLIGDVLVELGYPLTAQLKRLSRQRLNLRLTRVLYHLRFDVKHWAKTRTRSNEIWHREVPILAPSSVAALGISPKNSTGRGG